MRGNSISYESCHLCNYHVPWRDIFTTYITVNILELLYPLYEKTWIVHPRCHETPHRPQILVFRVWKRMESTYCDMKTGILEGNAKNRPNYVVTWTINVAAVVRINRRPRRPYRPPKSPVKRLKCTSCIMETDTSRHSIIDRLNYDVTNSTAGATILINVAVSSERGYIYGASAVFRDTRPPMVRIVCGTNSLVADVSCNCYFHFVICWIDWLIYLMASGCIELA